MEIMLNQFIGYNVKAPDGYVGKVCDFYFDDRSWRVIYLVVDTGDWLNRKIVISPLALLQPDIASKTFPVRITRKQVQISPTIDTSMVPRDELPELCEYFGWPMERNTYIRFFKSTNGQTRLSLFMPDLATANEHDMPDQYFTRFRRTQGITGCMIKAPETVLGRVSDYIIEDSNWQIRYLVIRVEKSISQKLLLMDSRHLTDVHWSENVIELNL